MTAGQHAEWLREGVQSWNRRRKKVSFSPDLRGVNFFDFLPPDFRDSPKTSRYFERIDLSDADLSGANLSHLNFSHGKFSGANLSNSDMSLSNFNGANFKDANLSKANAQMSQFVGSIFENTNLRDADLHGASIIDSTFIGTVLTVSQRRNLEAWSEINPKDELLDSPVMRKISDGAMKIEGAGGLFSRGQAVEVKTPKIRYDVFFGTNRNKIVQRGEIVDYGDANAEQLSYGVCEVIVPEGHRIGSLGSPLWKRLMNRHDDRLSVHRLISLDSELFGKYIRDSARRMKRKECPTIFVHGFNTTFKDAVLRAAQIGYDLGVGQGIGLFSWPSKGKIYKYTSDEAAVEVSKYLLAEFIKKFISDQEGRRVNIIAHSMGCRCAIGALEVLAKGNTNTLKRINQVILAAADIDAGIMPHQGVDVIKHCRRVTSYVSDLDAALKVSGWLHSFPRVGITPPTFVLSGMDTVLVNDLDLGNFSHAYVGSSRTILSDIFALLKSNAEPVDRHAIERVSDNFGNYWRMKS
ncbi:hypothetical protein BMG03_17040 [Thioclava nitratireducens]|uniref:Alpha/beta hydrolase n=1 Tax=Thioclava nitratireducens TaxID=1915078 RepID=A0ABM6IK32_9RHOB|nr:alpha/beta hydrolase [Thioclava nitratireducens]AQS49307.1 hypothetical protein BMG03_17040 [Thioclava nitratireducens]